VTERLDKLRVENEAKLEAMRATVEEKLQGTLEKRLGESFSLVSERLEMVHKGLGEMQSLAIGVGDLKRVMSNVKDRGGWAEVQLGAMLEQMLARDQYVTNAKVELGATEMVEYAVRMPGQGEDVLLPIDAKFPKETYERLMMAWEAGDGDALRIATDELAGVIEGEAKRISTKYIRPPVTTDFAVMYVPTEGLFAEAMRAPGLAHRIQSRYRVTIAGPSTLHALLNSLQMGFRTLAIQKRSSEVWRVLGEAKAEFQKYAEVWDKLDKQLQTAQKTIQEAGVRTRAVERKLRQVEVTDLPAGAQVQLELASTADEPENNEPVPLRRLQ
jgi:DNA recombination protein RmuC